MSLDVAVRPATLEDRRTLLRFTEALQAHELSVTPNRLPPKEMAEPHLTALEEWVRKTGGATFVAVRGEDLIGYAVCGIDEEFGCFVLPENQRYGRISDLYVEGDARGLGAGTKLIRACAAHLQSRGVSRVAITAMAGNTVTAMIMLVMNMKKSKSPMSAWNLSAEKTQVETPIAIVSATNTTAIPVSYMVS